MKITKIIVVTGLVGIAVAGVFQYSQVGNKPKPVKSAEVIRGDLVVAVSASGSVEPSFQVEVKSKASGEILEFPFEPGDKVKAGETLLKLDQRVEKRNLAQREADLAGRAAEVKSARASLLESEINLNRAKTLHTQKLTPQQELDSAIAKEAVSEAKVGVAMAAVRKARLAVDDAKERLSDTVIASPIDGVIIEKSVERGQIISSGISSVTGGTKLALIADMSRVFILALVDETDIGKVSVAQESMVTVDAYPDKTFGGTVVRVYPMGEMRDNITIFKVKIEVLGENNHLLRPKMTANADMILSRSKGVLIAPEEAVREGDDGAQYLYVLGDGGLSKREVTTGKSNGIDIEIIKGVSEGEKIALRPPVENDDSHGGH